MPYRQPLVPHILHVADPIELPVRAPGERGASRLRVATPVAEVPGGVRLRSTLTDDETCLVDVTAVAEGVIRVRLAPAEDTVGRAEAAIALVRPQPAADARVDLRADGASVTAGPLRAEIDFGPWGLRFLDEKGRVLTEQNTDETDITKRLRVLPFGRSLATDGSVLAYHETFAARADEHFFGLGEKFTTVDKRGQHVVSWNYDAFGAESERSYKNVPLYLSSRGYGVFVASGTAVEFDICHSTHSCVQITVPDDLLDYYLIAGPTLDRVLERYHRLTGRPVEPPKWALGTWISTGYLKIGQDETVAQARRIREAGIPCDVLHMDAYWQTSTHWSDMSWDAERYPDPVPMLRELTALGFRVCLWMNSYISHLSPLFAEGDAKGYFLRRADGSTYVADVWHSSRPPCGIVDFTQPDAVRWFQELLRPLLEAGVSVFKTDFGEGVPVDAVAAGGMRGDALHNVYSLLFNDAVVEVTERYAGHRVVWARASFSGGQRHCGQWAGDTSSTYASMASTLRGGLSYAFSGMPYWSHDVGGFTGTPTPDLYLRSAQFGAFSPLLRFHGMRSRFPWDFPAEIGAAVIDVLRLRYRLMPYLYSAAVEAARTGFPIMRPLALQHGDDPGTYAAELEYLFGPDLLVAPMIDPDGERTLYLPAGDWVDFWTGEVHAGGRHLRVSKPLGQIPLFARYGAVVATTEPVPAVGDEPFPAVTLVSWGEGDGEATVHDVNGSTQVRVSRRAGRAEVTSAGPLAVTGLALPPVAGLDLPETVTINGAPARIVASTPWPVAVR